MKIALICIATGKKYWPFAEKMIESAHQFFPEPIDVFLFTDSTLDFFPYGAIAEYTIIPAKGFPQETLQRYATILLKEKVLETYDQIWWVDSDMLFVAPVGDIFSDGITATLHPGFPPINPFGVPENTRPDSTAYLQGNSRYFCGGFNGGDARVYLKMARKLRENIDIDTVHGIIAIHNDESHLNHYLHHNPPAKVLDQSYCYPESSAGPGYDWVFQNFKPILVAREKNFAK